MANWTILDGGIYVDSFNGNDANPGTQLLPKATLNAGATALAGSGKLVINGEFAEAVGALFASIDVYADGEAIIDGTTIGGNFHTGFPGGTWNGFTLKNFVFLIKNNNGFTAENLNLSDGTINPNGTNVTYSGCTFENLHFNCSLITTFIGNTFIGDLGFARFGSLTLPIVITNFNSNIFVDTIIDYSSSAAVSFDNNLYNYTNPANFSVEVDAVEYTNLASLKLAHPTFNTQSISSDPLFNNTAIGDYTLDITSPARNLGVGGIKAGARNRGINKNGLSTELSLAGGAIYTNVSADGSGFITLDGGFTTGTVLSAAIDLGVNRTLGHTRKFALQTRQLQQLSFDDGTSNPDHLIYRMRTHPTSATTVLTEPINEFIWETIPMLDGAGVGNGADAYNPATGVKIVARYIQIEITFKGTL